MVSHSIVVIGNANVDLTTYVNHAPAEGETVLGHDFSIGMGGKGANQAVAAARASGDVSFIGRVGDDAFGALVLETLGGEGLDLTHLEQIPGKSGVASIYVDSTGSNRIAVFTGASGTLDADLARSAINAHPDIRFLVSQLEISQEAVLAALEGAQEKGATTVLNIAPYAPLLPGILSHTDWLIANEVEMAGLLSDVGLVVGDLSITPESLAAELSGWAGSLGCNVIVTLGEQGAIGCEAGGEPFWYSADPVSARDTVGAGDCFVGYFVAFLYAGLTWKQALAGGVLAASESVTRAGAQSSYPDREDTARIRAQITI
jgi:ribokinase